jgi:hypothetical protein
MTGRDPSKSIFDGTDDIISSALSLRPGATLKQKSTCRELTSGYLAESDFKALISNLYDQIESNRSDRMPSRENWRLERQTTISHANRSPEVLLERAIAVLGDHGLLDEWYNQIPVASGLIDGRADKRAAIDLLRLSGEKVEFIELKWGSDNPAFAAFEILRYGLAYLLSYVNRASFGYDESPLMEVDRVSLRVLAPQIFYSDCDLAWLGKGLSRGIGEIFENMTGQAITMDFGFLAFPAGFEQPFRSGEEVLRMQDAPEDADPCGSLVYAMHNLEPIWDVYQES